MEEKVRCQSCGMPLTEGFRGSETDGSESLDYCTYCYRDGAFTKPDLTLDDMIYLSVTHMTGELNIPITEAEDLAHSVLPALKRWIQQ